MACPYGIFYGFTGCGKTRWGTLCSAGILPASAESKGVAGWKPALRPAPKEFFRSLFKTADLKGGGLRYRAATSRFLPQESMNAGRIGDESWMN
jgi:hypothetical protein